MSEPKPKSMIRLLLESGPTDPFLITKLNLLEELQAAHARNDHKTMLEIGQKLAANDKAFGQARENRRAMMKKTVVQAKATADPDERAKKLLAAFEFCVKAACEAKEESQDIATFNFGVKQLGVISDELSATPPDRFIELAQFLDSPDIRVRAFAAVWLRHIMPERILPILKEIDKTEGFGTPAGTQVHFAISELELEERKKQNNTARNQKEPDAKS
ncbi:MAG TPA: hypothetical protein VNF99_20195 [Stellaceae bacterium]|nr:hypothetical protein [Stellaceae bacterium]